MPGSSPALPGSSDSSGTGGAPPTDDASSTAPTPAEPAKSYSRRAAAGLFWVSLTTAIGRVASLVASLVLGWLLTEDDFGLQALATSIFSVVLFIQDGGALRMLRHSEEYERLGRAVGQVTLGFNIGGGLIILLAAPIAAWIYKEPLLIPMLAIVAVSLPLNNRPMIRRTKLMTDMRFRELARMGTLYVLVRNGAMIAFALLGFGPFSFALPLIVVALVDWWYVARLVPGPIPGQPVTRAVFMEIIHAGKWIMVGLVASAIGIFGINAPIGWYFTTDQLGAFFFGMNVAITPAVMFASGMRQVLVPTLARVSHDLPRQAAALKRALRVLCFIGGPVCFGVAVVSAPLVDLFWNGKWNSVIPVVQLLTIAAATRMWATVAGIVLEAQARWRLRAVTLSAEAILALVMAGAGAWYGVTYAADPIAMAAVFVAIQWLIVGVGHCVVSAICLREPVHRVLLTLVPSNAIALAAALIVAWSVMPAVREWPSIGQVMALGSMYAAVVLGLLFMFERRMFGETIGLFRRR